MLFPVRTRNRGWVPSLFDEMFEDFGVSNTHQAVPAINVIEAKEHYKLELAAPGMTKEDFTVNLDEDNGIVIAMEKKVEQKETSPEQKQSCEKHCRYLRREFSYTKFQQTFILPEDVDKEKISAEVKHGVLTVVLPKKVIEEVPLTKRSIMID
jgi:HSP20 family protein